MLEENFLCVLKTFGKLIKPIGCLHRKKKGGGNIYIYYIAYNFRGITDYFI